VRQINNNIRNQFELPVLFYVLLIVGGTTRNLSIPHHAMDLC
jgi:hypothetical protein